MARQKQQFSHTDLLEMAERSWVSVRHCIVRDQNGWRNDVRRLMVIDLN